MAYRKKYLLWILILIPAALLLRNKYHQTLNEKNPVCEECEGVTQNLQSLMSKGLTYDEFLKITKQVCTSIVPLYDAKYCEDFLNMGASQLYYIMQSQPDLDPSDVCGQILTTLGCKSNHPKRDWKVNIPGKAQPYVEQVIPQFPTQTLIVLQLSDTHVDPFYAPGSSNNCHLPLCCRKEHGEIRGPEDEAWYWGDYHNCGMPTWTFDNMLKHIKETHKDIEMILWTGDVIPHNWWETTINFNLMAYNQTYQALLNAFQDIPIFPVLGNHDTTPIDQWPNPGQVPEDLDNRWLYEDISEKWATLLPQGYDSNTLLTGGFYSVLVKPGFRIIALNTNFGLSTDLWLITNSEDIRGELAWLTKELLIAEGNDEAVFLLGHIPPGAIDADRTWSREFNRIYERFASTIRGIFYGHTHKDEFEIFYCEGETPCGVAYIAPSVSSWENFNPAYRIYTVDGNRQESTWTILDSETWILNLTQAHIDDYPKWKFYYSAKESYKMKSLAPSQWERFALNMANDKATFEKYYRHYYRESPIPLVFECDDLCYGKRMCDVFTSDRSKLDICYATISVTQNKNHKQDF